MIPYRNQNLSITAPTMRMLRCAQDALGETAPDAVAERAILEWLKQQFPDIEAVSNLLESQRKSTLAKSFKEAVERLKT